MDNEKRTGVTFSKEFYQYLDKIPTGIAIPCSCHMDDILTGAILLTCAQYNFDFFKISPDNLPHPDFHFRMLENNQKQYLIEIELIIEKDKHLLIHLNPSHKSVIRLFKLFLEREMFAIHIYHETKFWTIYTNFDNSEIEWLAKNIKLMSVLKHNLNYIHHSLSLSCELDPNKRYFVFDENFCKNHPFIEDSEINLKILG